MKNYKNVKVEWNENVEISQSGIIPGNRWSMQGYILTYARLQRQNL